MKNAIKLKAFVKNIAKEKKISAQVILQNYMMERLLERISLSKYKEHFILKGGFLLSSMVGLDTRSIMNMDATIKVFPTKKESITEMFQEICKIEMYDAISFSFDDILDIREDDKYSGFRASLTGNYPPMSVPVKIDITIGDKIIPSEITYKFNLMFEDRQIDVLSYPIETILAEKLETIISRGDQNTRPRDFYDIYVLKRLQGNSIDFKVLKDAFTAIATNRGTIHIMEKYGEILEVVENSEVMILQWTRYQKEFDYAKSILFKDICKVINGIMNKMYEDAEQINIFSKNYFELEDKFKVIYPGSSNATYTSLLNYSDDLDKSFQRWYRYKEGFSIELVQHLIAEYSKHNKGTILDPFSGSGSTLLAANKMGYSGVGFEVNPFSYFLSKCKLANYKYEDIKDFKNSFESILNNAINYYGNYKLPNLSISRKVFNKDLEKYFMSVGELIKNNTPLNKKVRDLLKLGWLACLEPLSNYRKAGNGLKIKKYVKPRIVTVEDAKKMLFAEYNNIYNDLLEYENKSENILYQESCLNMQGLINDDSIEGIIFSPPYANCFDYTEIYKLELWFGEFVKEYSDLKKIRNNSLRSHLNGDLSINVKSKSVILTNLLIELKKKELWDKKIPKMLQLYFDDMFKVIDESYRVLDDEGFCCIVVGNSAYGGIIFPTDLILAEYAEEVGFIVHKIEVDRFIITSSQQYKLTKENGKYLRESVVCLIKKK